MIQPTNLEVQMMVYDETIPRDGLTVSESLAGISKTITFHLPIHKDDFPELVDSLMRIEKRRAFRLFNCPLPGTTP